MDREIHDKVSAYLRNQLAQANSRLQAYTLDLSKRPLPTRGSALVLDKYLRDFRGNRNSLRWVAVTGLRGVGKTTLLAQIYTVLEAPNAHKLYISLDEAKRLLGVSLQDILTVYEEILGEVYEELTDPVFLFIDEVQYDPDWAIALKSIYDRSKNVFILCTGSSALSLRMNPDVSRRVTLERLYPMSFTEYILLKTGRKPITGLGKTIREAIFESNNAEEVFQALERSKSNVMRYWSPINRLELDKYLKYGTLPSTLNYSVEQEPLIYEQIERTLTAVVDKDIPQVKRFDQTTIARINQILYYLAGASITSYGTISNNFSLAINTVIDVLAILEQSEVLLRVYPHASLAGQSKRPSKYLFLSPAYRSMFFNLVGSVADYDSYKGMLFEDAVGLYLHRILGRSIKGNVTYDPAEGGADFITNSGQKKVAIEVGYGRKDFRQVQSAIKNTGAAYGISVSTSSLELSEDKTCVKVPFSYFLLM